MRLAEVKHPGDRRFAGSIKRHAADEAMIGDRFPLSLCGRLVIVLADFVFEPAHPDACLRCAALAAQIEASP